MVGPDPGFSAAEGQGAHLLKFEVPTYYVSRPRLQTPARTKFESVAQRSRRFIPSVSAKLERAPRNPTKEHKQHQPPNPQPSLLGSVKFGGPCRSRPSGKYRKGAFEHSQGYKLVKCSPVASCLGSSLPGRKPSRLTPTNVGTLCAFFTGCEKCGLEFVNVE